MLVLCGPTGAGKTGWALQLARHWPIGVISADSRQVYRGLDIGTAKASDRQRRQVPHALLDVASPDDGYTVAAFQEAAQTAVTLFLEQGYLPVVVGGTGLYLQALLRGLAPTPQPQPQLRQRLWRVARQRGSLTLYRWLQRVDPQLAQGIPLQNLVRIIRGLEVYLYTGRPLSVLQQEHAWQQSGYDSLCLALAPPRAQLYAAIEQRVEQMFAQGLVAEVKSLLQQGCDPQGQALRTIGYQEVVAYLQGEISLATAKERIKRNTRRYAKRQLTWLRRDETLYWLDPCHDSAKLWNYVVAFYAQ